MFPRYYHHPLLAHLTVVFHGIGIGIVTPGWSLRHLLPHTSVVVVGFFRSHHLFLLVHIPVTRCGIGLGLVIQLAATAPTTSNFLVGRGFGS